MTNVNYHAFFIVLRILADTQLTLLPCVILLVVQNTVGRCSTQRQDGTWFSGGVSTYSTAVLISRAKLKRNLAQRAVGDKAEHATSALHVCERC